jgi:hypothetical protein
MLSRPAVLNGRMLKTSTERLKAGWKDDVENDIRMMGIVNWR